MFDDPQTQEGASAASERGPKAVEKAIEGGLKEKRGCNMTGFEEKLDRILSSLEVLVSKLGDKQEKGEMQRLYELGKRLAKETSSQKPVEGWIPENWVDK